LEIKVQVRHGDTPERERRRQATSPPDLLITTPETFQILLIAPKLKAHLKNTRYVIIDEIHELADSKRGSQLAIALERLADFSEFQRIGLSATIGGINEVMKFLGGNRKVEVVDISIAKQLDFQVRSPALTEEDKELARKLLTEVENAAEIRYIKEILEQRQSVLIFVNTRQAAEALGARLKMLGVKVEVHHSSLSRDARIEAENAFKEGRLKALICTSSMELGIDIGLIDHVVQYHSPREVTRLLQRVGRSGHRVGDVSSGTIIASEPDDIAEACVIARRAKNCEIEQLNIYKEPMDVIANQICAAALEHREVNAAKIYQLIKKAYPFEEFSFQRFQQILNQLKEQRLISMENGMVKRGKRTWQYFYENLSMIPDEKRYEVYDIVRGRSIASLDEAFAVNFAQNGAIFIAKGEMWRVLDVAGDKIKVEPVENPEGEIPRWSGEEIPVPFEVAQEVGMLRAEISKLAHLNNDEIAQLILKQREYHADVATFKKVIQLVKEQIKAGCEVPTHDKITIESNGKTVILNACFGHRVNETIGRVLSSLLAARFGSSVALEIDPYRIKLELPKKTSAEQIAELIRSIKAEHLEPIIEITLKQSSLLKWKLLHVARRFGAARKDVDQEKIGMDKLISIYSNTPLYEEAIREIYHDKLDIPRAREIFSLINRGEISIAISNLSPIGLSGYTAGYELLYPEKIDQSIVLALKNRILNDRVLLICLNCKQWKSTQRVMQVQEQPKCALCGSRLIAALKPWEEGEIKLLKKPEHLRTQKEKNRVKRIFRNANLVLSHGKQAVIALSSRGLGPEAASRILRRQHVDEEDFYREILKAERQYIKTKKYWDL
ncbi:MAG: DEAD/DEAH box helicase, partial [Halobacteria archaeon]